MAEEDWPQEPEQRKVILADWDHSSGFGDRRQEIVFIGVNMNEAKIIEQVCVRVVVVSTASKMGAAHLCLLSVWVSMAVKMVNIFWSRICQTLVLWFLRRGGNERQEQYHGAGKESLG